MRRDAAWYYLDNTEKIIVNFSDGKVSVLSRQTLSRVTYHEHCYDDYLMGHMYSIQMVSRVEYGRVY